MIVNKQSSIKVAFFTAAILALLFFNSNLSVFLGFGESTRTYSNMLIMLYIAYQFLSGSFNFKSVDATLNKLLALGVICTIFFSINNTENFKYYFFFSITPFIIYSYCDIMTEWERTILRKCIISVIVVETGIAFYENITKTNLIADEEFAHNAIITDAWAFRAPALYGHPIANAMIVSIIYIFALSSSYLTDKMKLTVAGLTVVALFCFNERANIILSLLAGCPYLYSIYKKGTRKTKAIFYVFIVCLIGFLINAEKYNFGGRLFNIEIGAGDNSTMARLAAFEVLEHLDVNDILFGDVSEENVFYAMQKLNIRYIENGIVMLLMQFGLLFGILTIILLLLLQIKKLSVYKKWQRLIILLLFYTIGMTNPHLSNPIQWMMFFLAFYAFTPRYCSTKR